MLFRGKPRTGTLLSNKNSRETHFFEENFAREAHFQRKARTKRYFFWKTSHGKLIF